MNKLYSFILKLVRDDRGQDTVEYTLMAGFVAVAAAGLLPGFTDNITVIFSKIASLTTPAASA